MVQLQELAQQKFKTILVKLLSHSVIVLSTNGFFFKIKIKRPLRAGLAKIVASTTLANEGG
jgi:hypothetical protein